MYIYKNNLGGFFASEEQRDPETLICKADTAEECWNQLKDKVSINGSGGYNCDYVKEFIEDVFEDNITELVNHEKQIRPKSNEIVEDWF